MLSNTRYGYERAASDECNTQCSSTSKRVQMRKYCDMDYVYLVTVLGKERADRKWTVFRWVECGQFVTTDPILCQLDHALRFEYMTYTYITLI